jgi:quinohemoprotein ethanol dehydrogenase
VYIPYMQLGFRFTRAPDRFLGVVATPAHSDDPYDGRGALIAWDPVTQTQRWIVWHKWIWNGGTLTTAGGLVFQGAADGRLTAYDAENGQVLWRFDAGLGIIAPPISYAWKGTQYVSLLVGWAGPNPYGNDIMPTGWRYNAQPRRLLTFALDGKAKLPQTPPYDETVHPVDDPSIELDPADVAAGDVLYDSSCRGCHGGHTQSSGAPGPDLRESAIALDKEAMWMLLHDGLLLSRGMPRFGQLSREQVGQLYSYIRARAREAAAAKSRSQ